MPGFKVSICDARLSEVKSVVVSTTGQQLYGHIVLVVVQHTCLVLL